MKSFNPEVITHKINVNSTMRPKNRKKGSLSKKKCHKKKKVNSLKVGWVGEIDYFTWLSNVVLAPKASGDAWMCIDFISLTRPHLYIVFHCQAKSNWGMLLRGLV